MKQNLLVRQRREKQQKRDHPHANDEGANGCSAKAHWESQRRVRFKADTLVVKKTVQTSLRQMRKP